MNGAFAFWSQGRAIRAAASGASLTIETHCQYTHGIYVGTRLDTTCGIVTATLDGGAPVTLDCYYPAATTSQTRRLLRAGESGIEASLDSVGVGWDNENHGLGHAAGGTRLRRVSHAVEH